MYTNLNGIIERVTKWICIYAIEAILIGITITSIITSYVNYYILDLKDESFSLSIPIVYVTTVDELIKTNIKIKN